MAGQGSRAAQLDHPQLAGNRVLAGLLVEPEDAVADGELWLDVDGRLAVLPDQQAGGVPGGEQQGQVVGEGAQAPLG
ncbi:MAG: hypothetical protein HY690_14105 [Chloroflexi bacterium]|nr:hypothetical protein [Chloroflexota bacterium]